MAIGTLWMALQALLLSPVMPIWILAKFQILAGLVLGLGARLPQIVLNHKNGHTGNLAPHTFIFNLTANCINGVCATVLTGDILVIATQVWMFSLNCTVVSQIWRSNRRRRAASALALAQHPNLDDGRVSYSRVSLEGEPQREGAWPRLA